jgi:hypothetical protein
MHAQNLAFVAHRTSSRIRIKIPDRQRHRAYFEALKRALLDHPDILDVRVNPLTASVIIECRAGFQLTVDNNFHGLKFAATEVFAPLDYYSISSVRLAHGMRLSVGQLLLAIATRQLGMQLGEWIIQVILQAAAREVDRPTISRQALVRHEGLVVAMTTDNEPERPSGLH